MWDRRTRARTKTDFMVNEVVNERLHRCMVRDISAGGLLLERVRGYQDFSRPLQLEITLPGIAETIWASGRVTRLLAQGELVLGTGVSFMAIPTTYQEMIHHFVTSRKEARRNRLMEAVDEWFRSQEPLH